MSVPEDHRETLPGMDDEDIADSSPATVQETTAYQGQKFDLIGFSDYFPFGLKQVYAAASSLNQMLHAHNREEEAKVSKPVSPKNSKKGLGGHPTHNSESTSLHGNRAHSSVKESSGRLDRLTDISRSRYR